MRNDDPIALAKADIERRMKFPWDMGFLPVSSRGGEGQVKAPWLGSYLHHRMVNPAAARSDLLQKLKSLDAPCSQKDDACRGALLGLAIGDALGTTLEFKARDQGRVDDIVGGGPFGLEAGFWTDDTSMASCLAYSLIKSQGFDARHQMESYSYWYRYGAYSPTGTCFDIGVTVRNALENFLRTGEPYSGSEDPSTAGNGSLMRLAPVVLWRNADFAEAVHYAGESSRTTHQAKEAVDACRYWGALLYGAINGVAKDVLLNGVYSPVSGYWERNPLAPTVREVAEGSYKHKLRSQIQSTGYVIHTLESALWAFNSTEDFRSGALAAVNLAGDSDTTGAVYGQLAGAFYGETGIPISWIMKTHAKQGFYHFASDFLASA